MGWIKRLPEKAHECGLPYGYLGGSKQFDAGSIWQCGKCLQVWLYEGDSKWVKDAPVTPETIRFPAGSTIEVDHDGSLPHPK